MKLVGWANEYADLVVSATVKGTTHETDANCGNYTTTRRQVRMSDDDGRVALPENCPTKDVTQRKLLKHHQVTFSVYHVTTLQHCAK